MAHLTYAGSELDLFDGASNWKSYYTRLMKNYLGKEVLEVGAGIGATTARLYGDDQRRWVCLEPDPDLAATLRRRVTETLPNCEVRQGTLADLAGEEMFDSIIYADVLEHIKDDAAEVRRAAARLRAYGTLVVLAPAHQWLFTPFDEAIGHRRRYDRRGLSKIMPEDLQCVRLDYLDCAGLLASLGNRLLLKSGTPDRRQIALWDKGMVPLSTVLDPLLRYSVGKSVFGVWRKTPGEAGRPEA